MDRNYSFALGSLWQWSKSKNRDDLIKYARQLDINGVELTFSNREELCAFNLSEENVGAFLRGYFSGDGTCSGSIGCSSVSRKIIYVF